ncbi:MAG TPA: PAS domain-containing protein [Terriglobia bacterium]|nr:PAS domain-containing protein [Terriglobia bacterium]
MALLRNTAPPLWPTGHLGSTAGAERNLRDLSHISLLVFAGAAVAAGVVAGTSWSSEFGADVSWAYILVVILLPLLCGLLLREVWRVRKLENQVKRQQAAIGFVEGALSGGDNTPAGLLIVSSDLRVRFANQSYLDSMLQAPEEVLGWRMQDALSVEGLEDRAHALLHGPDPAASCCFAAIVPTGLCGERPVHITMTRIAPRLGEDRILVLIEELHPSWPLRPGQPVEGYAC